MHRLCRLHRGGKSVQRDRWTWGPAADSNTSLGRVPAPGARRTATSDSYEQPRPALPHQFIRISHPKAIALKRDVVRAPHTPTGPRVYPAARSRCEALSIACLCLTFAMQRLKARPIRTALPQPRSARHRHAAAPRRARPAAARPGLGCRGRQHQVGAWKQPSSLALRGPTKPPPPWQCLDQQHKTVAAVALALRAPTSSVAREAPMEAHMLHATAPFRARDFGPRMLCPEPKAQRHTVAPPPAATPNPAPPAPPAAWSSSRGWATPRQTMLTWRTHSARVGWQSGSPTWRAWTGGATRSRCATPPGGAARSSRGPRWTGECTARRGQGRGWRCVRQRQQRSPFRDSGR
jgi:hypothetical protein